METNQPASHNSEVPPSCQTARNLKGLWSLTGDQHKLGSRLYTVPWFFLFLPESLLEWKHHDGDRESSRGHFFHAPFEGEVPEPDYKERRGWMTESWRGGGHCSRRVLPLQADIPYSGPWLCYFLVVWLGEGIPWLLGALPSSQEEGNYLHDNLGSCYVFPAPVWGSSISLRSL